MHIVLITSMLRPVRDYTVFSVNQRKEQTLYTIATVREKIPNSHIIMIEGGHIDEYEKNTFEGLVDHLVNIDVTKYNKSPGEATLLYRYLTSDHFKSLKNIETVSKLSGRYYLNEHFHWDKFPQDKCIIAFVPVAWSGRPVYNTRYYRIPPKHLSNFIHGLGKYLTSKESLMSFPDIEHCFYSHNIILHDEVYSPDPLGVCGLITGTSQFVSD